MIDDMHKRNKLRLVGWFDRQINALFRLRKKYQKEEEEQKTIAVNHRLAFIRWLVEQGRLEP